MSNKDRELTHPSYAVATFRRTSSSGRRLFGSSLQNHYSTIRFCVARAIQRTREDGSVTFEGSMRSDLIELEFSAAQFAELLTTMNVGDGVPCTVVRVNRESVEEPPALVSEVESIHAEFKNHTDSALASFKEGVLRAQQVLATPGPLKKPEKEQIQELLREVLRDMTDVAPFMVERFQTAAAKTVNAGKTEVDAFVTHAVHRTGLDVLRTKQLLSEPDSALQLTAHKDPADS